MSVASSLSNAEMFKDLSPGSIEAIVKIVNERELEEGDTVYALGDDATDLFVLTAGRVRFMLGVHNRPDSGASIMKPGAVFGWAALLGDQPRRVATSVCLEDSKVLVISGAELQNVFEADLETGYRVMRRLATMITRDYLSDMSV